MALKNKILSILDPQIGLEKMATMDTIITNPNSNTEQRKDTLKDDSKIFGDLFPFIQVGKYKFTHDSIRSLKLEEDSFLPEITVTLIDTNGNLNSAFFPKADEKLSVYIRSKKEQYKPIRADFLITDVTPMSSGNSEMEMHGKTKTFTISGVLFIPKLWTYNIKAYREQSSFELFKQLAREMLIGYATNEVSTDDKMTWINPNWNYETFIKESTKHVWKDDNSFFQTYIDKYYYLNLINVNNQFSDEQSFDDFIYHSLTMTDYLNKEEEVEDSAFPLIFSNYSKLRRSPMFITSYNLNSNLGLNLIENGVQRKMNYYDFNLPEENNLQNKYINLFVEPLITQNLKTKKNSLRPTDETLKKLEVHKWSGIDYGNGHLNYIFSKFNNFHNNTELNNIQLRITTLGANLNVIRGMRVPILIVNENSPENTHSNEYEEKELDGDIFEMEQKLGIKIDRFLSDFYYIDGLTIFYNHSDTNTTGSTTNFWTQMSLSKREWTPIPELNNNTNPNKPSSTELS